MCAGTVADINGSVCGVEVVGISTCDVVSGVVRGKVTVCVGVSVGMGVEVGIGVGIVREIGTVVEEGTVVDVLREIGVEMIGVVVVDVTSLSMCFPFGTPPFVCLLS